MVQHAIVHEQPDTRLGVYTRIDPVAPDGELASPTLPVRVAVTRFFAGAPDTTL